MQEFVSQAKLLSEAELTGLLSKMDGCVTADRDEFVKKIFVLLGPIIEARENNPDLKRAAEEIKRKEFLKSSVREGDEKKSFIPIEDTQDILSYHLGGNSAHLHLGPMQTLSTTEQLNFVKKTLPDSFKKLAEVLENDKQIEAVNATSYVVAAMPDLFQKYGFKIMTLDDNYRNNYWGNDERPILGATMSREDFLRLYKQETIN